jgi:hypothetical protein
MSERNRKEFRIDVGFPFIFLGIVFYDRAGKFLTMRLRHLAFKAMLYQVSVFS